MKCTEQKYTVKPSNTVNIGENKNNNYDQRNAQVSPTNVHSTNNRKPLTSRPGGHCRNAVIANLPQNY